MEYILPSKCRNSFVVFLLFCILPLHAQQRSDFFIHLGTTDSLDATSFFPNMPPPPNGFPALLFIHGFGTDKVTRIPSCSVYAANGYATLAYSVRGHGLSSGASTIMSTQERLDLRSVIEYMKHMPNVDSCAIGIVGSSQGGLHGLWAVVDGLDVKAVCTDVIVPQWASDMLTNGSVRRTLLLLLATKSVRYTSLRDTLLSFVVKDKYDSLLARFPQNRDLDLADITSSNIPIETFLKWQDHYFSPSNGIAMFDEQISPKILYIGTQGHFSDDDSVESYVQSDLIFRWFGKFLMHRETGILSQPPVTFAYSSLPVDSLGKFHWTDVAVSSFPPEGVSSLELFFNPDSSLTEIKRKSHHQPVTLENLYLNPKYTFDTAYIEGFRGSRFEKLLPQQRILFTSAALASDFYWIGEPSMKLFVSSQNKTFPLHAQIFEVDSLGNEYFINRINFTARHWKKGSAKWIAVKGIPHAHRFSAGSRIRVVLTNIDKTNRTILGSFPFVLPVFSHAGVKIFFDTQHPSSISLPVVGTASFVQTPPKPVFRNLKK